MLKANYHTHTKLCNHAVGMPEDYVKQAIKLGYKELGMSDHGPVPRDFMSDEEYKYNWLERHMTLDEYYSIYLESLDDVIKKYGDKIKILRGLEIEYIPGHEEYYIGLKANLDYLNLGVHYFLSNGRQISSYSDVNYKTIYDYMNIAIKGMETGIFNILVHPDLFFYAYKDENGEQTFDNHCKIVSRRIIEAAIKNNVYLEINANGPSNSRKANQKEWLYPREEFWKIAKEYKDLKIIIGADAHHMEQLACSDLEAVIKFSKQLGLQVKDFLEIND